MGDTAPGRGRAGEPRQPATVGSILSAAAGTLAEAGCASPLHDAEQLMMHVSGRSRTDLILSRRDAVAADDPLATDLPALVRRRAAREPLQHIIGTAPMGRLELQVGPGVFVPRPETELLAQWCVDALAAGNTGAPVVVDLCTGSGALALAIADAVPPARVTGVELDPRARRWADRNVAACRRLWAGEGVPRTGTVEVVAGDVVKHSLVDGGALSHLRGAVDLVVSNPPYVPLSAEVSAEVRHDPQHAVFGGDDGLDVIRPMMNVVRELLRPGGIVAIEHDDASGPDMIALLRGTGEWRGIEVHRDLAGRDRFTTATFRPRGRGHEHNRDHTRDDDQDEGTDQAR